MTTTTKPPAKTPGENIDATSILDAIEDAVVLVDPSWTISYVNRCVGPFFGVEPHEVLGENLWTALPEATSALFLKLQQAANERVALTVEGIYPPAEKWFEARITPHTKGVQIVFKDITARKALNEQLTAQRTYFESLLNSMVEGVIISDDRGIITLFNPAAEKIFGYESQEIVGKSVSVLMTMPDAQEHDSHIKHYIRTADTRVVGMGREVMGRRKNGEEFVVEIALADVKIDGRHNFIATARDMTDRKRAQTELVRHREHLEELVEMRTRDLEMARDRALEASKSKSAFLANMSHELRTPLNAIIGYAEIIQEETAGLDSDELSLDVRKIQSAGKHLLTLINDVLDLSKIEAGKMENHIEPFNVGLVVEDVVSSVEPLVSKNKNRVTVSIGDDVGEMESDLTKVRQILFNLISNANKFTTAGTVLVEVARQAYGGADWIIMRVSDTGVGMNAEQRRRVFEPFVQGDNSTTRRHGGTGLGLTITHRLCGLLGGSIHVDSTPGHGSTFSVRIPVKVPRPMAEERKWFSVGPKVNPELVRLGYDEKDSDERRHRISTILVIDDDANVRDLMERFLTRQGFYTYTAANADEGIAMARELRPDLITLDVMMPEKDGWWVLTQLKHDETVSDIPVVMLTMVEDEELGYALGAADYLNKPVDQKKLIDVISRHARNWQERSALVIEPEESAQQQIREALEAQGVRVVTVNNTKLGLIQLRMRIPDLIVIDLTSPQYDSMPFMDELKRNHVWNKIPVIATTCTKLDGNSLRAVNARFTDILYNNAKQADDFLDELSTLITKKIRQRDEDENNEKK